MFSALSLHNNRFLHYLKEKNVHCGCYLQYFVKFSNRYSSLYIYKEKHQPSQCHKQEKNSPYSGKAWRDVTRSTNEFTMHKKLLKQANITVFTRHVTGAVIIYRLTQKTLSVTVMKSILWNNELSHLWLIDITVHLRSMQSTYVQTANYGWYYIYGWCSGALIWALLDQYYCLTNEELGNPNELC